MFQRVLVPLDGSALAERALPVAAHIARDSACSVLLLQVVSPPVDYGGGFSHAPLMRQRFVDVELDDAHTYINKVASLDIWQGIHVQKLVLFGMPVACILNMVEVQNVNLIVLSSHGRSGFKRWILGSVARRIVHHSTVPVLMLRGEELALAEGPARPLRVMVAVDGSSLAETALLPTAQLVCALSTPQQGMLHILHVMEPYASNSHDGASPLYNILLDEQARTYLTAIRERLVAQVDASALIVTWSIAYGSDIAATIITGAENEDGTSDTGRYDLLAMATHGRGGLRRWVMGSITERVLEGTKLPILVARPAQTEEQQEQISSTERMGERAKPAE